MASNYVRRSQRRYSPTGAAGSWTFSPTKAYDNRIGYEDGSVRLPARRERPHVLFDAAGAPTHLYTAVQDRWPSAKALNDHTYTHVQPIRTTRFWSNGPRPGHSCTTIRGT